MGEIENLNTQLGSEFEMTDLGELSYFLGIEFMKTSRGIIMHQRKCITETLKRFHMQNCNSVAVPVEVNLKIDNSESEQNLDATLYRQIVGCLRFICHSRPEISHGVGVISRFTTRPKQSHLATTKRIRRYRKGIENCGILFPNQKEKGDLHLVGYTNSDWCGDKVDRRSTFGFVFLLSGAPISWSLRKQDVVAL
ncbi:secreted RxLR effector protein 161-like [Glycine max]|uniref:secreted RxLR effector protein 161-like n=1 Tax=Glycine max TaxID=3847 RepID=UPI0007193731|nr:secreted RxLR effector protein 161-like [Glycine max]